MTKGRRPADRKHIPKDAKPLYDAAMAQGFAVELTDNSHIVWSNPKIKPPARNRCVSGMTPARSSIGNLRADLRRIGLQT